SWCWCWPSRSSSCRTFFTSRGWPPISRWPRRVIRPAHRKRRLPLLRSRLRDPNRPDWALHCAANQRKLFVEEQSIVILDFGSQYTQLTAPRLRELKVFSAVLPSTPSLDETKTCAPAGIILSGGPCSVYDADAPPADERVLALGLPVLGICYGL